MFSRLFNRNSSRKTARQLPSVASALERGLGSKVAKKILSTNLDRRLLLQDAAREINLSEEDLGNQIAERLGLGFISRVPVMDMYALPNGFKISDFRSAGCIAITSNGLLTGLICVDPLMLDSGVFGNFLSARSNNFNLFLSTWTNIAKALEQSEEAYIQKKQALQQEQCLKREQAAKAALALLIERVRSFNQSSCDLQLDAERILFLFTTRDLKIASGTIDARIKEPLLQYLDKASLDASSCITLSDASVASNLKIKVIDPGKRLRFEWQASELKSPEIKSEPKSTSASVVYFPSDAIKRHGIELIQESDSTKPKKKPLVLVIDDNQVFSRVLERFLERNELSSIFTEDGDKAWQLLKAEQMKPDLIVCDVHMPRMNGFDFLKRLRSDPSFQRLPVIMLTSDNDIETEVKILGEGADAFVAKNKDPRILCAHIKRLLERIAKLEAA